MTDAEGKVYLGWLPGIRMIRANVNGSRDNDSISTDWDLSNFTT